VKPRKAQNLSHPEDCAPRILTQDQELCGIGRKNVALRAIPGFSPIVLVRLVFCRVFTHLEIMSDSEKREIIGMVAASILLAVVLWCIIRASIQQ
jgi:hypothetical protein